MFIWYIIGIFYLSLIIEILVVISVFLFPLVTINEVSNLFMSSIVINHPAEEVKDMIFQTQDLTKYDPLIS